MIIKGSPLDLIRRNKAKQATAKALRLAIGTASRQAAFSKQLSGGIRRLSTAEQAAESTLRVATVAGWLNRLLAEADLHGVAFDTGITASALQEQMAVVLQVLNARAVDSDATTSVINPEVAAVLDKAGAPTEAYTMSTGGGPAKASVAARQAELRRTVFRT